MEKQSAILPGYSNRSIHENHMDMKKFESSNNPGYKAISDQLWIWVDGIESDPAKPDSGIADAEHVRQKRNMKYTTLEHIHEPFSGSSYEGNVNAGGHVIQGDLSSGNNINIS